MKPEVIIGGQRWTFDTLNALPVDQKTGEPPHDNVRGLYRAFKGSRGASWIARAKREDIVRAILADDGEPATPPPSPDGYGPQKVEPSTPDVPVDIGGIFNVKALEELIRNLAGKAVNREEVESIATAVYKNLDRPREVSITRGADLPPVPAGVQHKNFKKLLRACALREHVYLHGPSGTGKTHVAKVVAEAFELPYYSTSVCSQTPKIELTGYLNAHGSYIVALFRKAYQEGGVFLIDEVDGGNANVLNVLNMALSNGDCPFPDQMVSKHPDFILIAAGNTTGLGADRKFAGRVKLDAAFRERFAFIPWGVDESLETAIAPNKDWAKRVQALRQAIDDLKVPEIEATQRTTLRGATFLHDGFCQSDVEEMLIWRGCDNATRNKIKARALEIETERERANS